MDLKTICMNNLVEIIKNLPPQLQEDVIGASTKAIKEEAEKKTKEKIMKAIKRSAAIVTEDVTERLIASHQTGQSWKRPEYTNDIDDEIYYTFVDVAEKFVNNYGEMLIFPSDRHRRQVGVYWDNNTESDEEYPDQVMY
jgi:hypothetical protein